MSYQAQFTDAIRAELAPQGALEETLASEIAHAAWRLELCGGADHSEADRARAQSLRIFNRCTAELRRVQTDRRLWSEFAPEQTNIGIASYKDILAARATEARRQTLCARLAERKADWLRSANPPTAANATPEADATSPDPGDWLRFAQQPAEAAPKACPRETELPTSANRDPKLQPPASPREIDLPSGTTGDPKLHASTSPQNMELPTGTTGDPKFDPTTSERDKPTAYPRDVKAPISAAGPYPRETEATRRTSGQ